MTAERSHQQTLHDGGTVASTGIGWEAALMNATQGAFSWAVGLLVAVPCLASCGSSSKSGSTERSPAADGSADSSDDASSGDTGRHGDGDLADTGPGEDSSEVSLPDTGIGDPGSDEGGVAEGGSGPGFHYDSIFSGVPMLDTTGALVNAHGVGFIKVGSTYYMVGEQRSGKNDTYTGAKINGEDSFTGVSMYSTTDFAYWTFVGTVVKPIAGTVVAPPYYGERPKILYNAVTAKYVIYIKMLNYTGNPPVYTGYYSVLTSSSISGPYAYHGNLSTSGANDFEVFQDTNGSQYLVRAEGTLYKLSSDGLSIASTVATGIQSGEGVSLYKAGSTYFWQSSQGTYWHSNDNSYSTASSVTGPWTSHGHFCPAGSDTWQSQDTAVVAVAGSAGTTYIYVGDRWVDGNLPASTLVVQPFAVSGDTESIATYSPSWNLDVGAGTWSASAPSGATVNDDTTGTGANQFNYGSGWTYGTLSGCYDGDAHSSSTADATATIAFSGTQILLYSAYNESSGIMGITLEDGTGKALTPETNVSLRYDASAAGNYLVYASPSLSRGSYALKVRVTGLKDLYSSGTTCTIDRALIVP
jgi:hypothetical protein